MSIVCNNNNSSSVCNILVVTLSRSIYRQTPPIIIVFVIMDNRFFPFTGDVFDWASNESYQSGGKPVYTTTTSSWGDVSFCLRSWVGERNIYFSRDNWMLRIGRRAFAMQISIKYSPSSSSSSSDNRGFAKKKIDVVGKPLFVVCVIFDAGVTDYMNRRAEGEGGGGADCGYDKTMEEILLLLRVKDGGGSAADASIRMTEGGREAEDDDGIMRVNMLTGDPICEMSLLAKDRDERGKASPILKFAERSLSSIGGFFFSSRRRIDCHQGSEDIQKTTTTTVSSSCSNTTTRRRRASIASFFHHPRDDGRDGDGEGGRKKKNPTTTAPVSRSSSLLSFFGIKMKRTTVIVAEKNENNSEKVQLNPGDDDKPNGLETTNMMMVISPELKPEEPSAKMMMLTDVDSSMNRREEALVSEEEEPTPMMSPLFASRQEHPEYYDDYSSTGSRRRMMTMSMGLDYRLKATTSDPTEKSGGDDDHIVDTNITNNNSSITSADNNNRSVINTRKRLGGFAETSDIKKLIVKGRKTNRKLGLNV